MTEPHFGGTYEDLLRLARWSEDNGLYSFARSDHYYLDRGPATDATDAFATLAGLSRDTSSIRLAVLVTPVTFRHPAVIVKNATTIDQMSGGRLDLGLGTGWMKQEHAAFGLPFPSWGERFARLEEAVGYARAAFGQGRGRFDGHYYQLDAEVSPKPMDLRLILGGSGKSRTPTLAGRHADEYNCLMRPITDLKDRIEVMKGAAGDRHVAITVMGQAVVGRTEAEFRERIEKAALLSGMSPEAMEKRYESRGIPMGTPSRAAETLAALKEIGVERYYVQWLDATDFDGFVATIEALRS